MNNRVAPSLFSRIVLILAVAASLGVAYWVGSQALEPVFVPLNVPARRAVSFDPKADVSKNPVFQILQPLGPEGIDPGVLGRQNPFVAPTSAAPSTSTTP